jgi:hypothetical protein
MPRRKTLLIGINYTGSEYELAGCINDVEHGLFIQFVCYLQLTGVTTVRRYLVHDKQFPHDPAR